MKGKWISVPFRVATSVLFLALVTYAARGRFREALSSLAAIQFSPLLLALGFNFISLIPVSLRLITILLVQGIAIPFRRMYYLWLISLFFNLFLPSAVGGDIVKAYYLAKDSRRKLASVTSVLLDRFFGLMATISVGSLAFLLARHQINDPKIGHVLFWFVVALLVVILFVMSRRFSTPARSWLYRLTPKGVHDRLLRLFGILDLYRARRGDFCIAYGYSLGAQCVFIFTTYLLARAIQMDLSMAHFFLFMPIVAVCSLVPSLGGLGVREAAIVYLFSRYAPVEKAVAFSILFDIFTYGIGVLCGILYAIRGGASIREIEEIESKV